MYIPRSIHSKVTNLKKGFPVISIVGPRQSGKTTYLRHKFTDYKYFNLEDAQTLLSIKDDPKGFFIRNPKNIIIDEIQRYPELFSYIQVHVDETQVMGGILISGSQNFLVSEKISQSLAGRAAYLTIYPLNIKEIEDAKLLNQNIYTQILKGGYPAVYTREVSLTEYFSNYVATYTERDVRQIRSITELTQFQNFMILLAGRVGQLLNVAEIARDLGISPHTVEDWISILEASYIVFRLRPYFKNIGKRLIKSPKLYFYDTGLLAYLLKIVDSVQLQNHYLMGNIFENFIISEIFKQTQEVQGRISLNFYRDSVGNEVDLLLDTGIKIIPVEIKASATYHSDFTKGIKSWNELFKSSAPGYIIFTGTEGVQVRNNKLLPWRDLTKVFDET